ncbi:hypothetical protein RND61_15370 [Streptomyces sp. TRM76323]|uniref:Uncharacterized protein n=1 Tax=Streptomyces tamarix TaxID=3078565 RepID=A0ABU3QLU7_9ACTN|nr:hypothetical protein [Streptomyces tamarix]MDT9683428.1 hypothetical protein [Streptomyces tamarix]
MEEIKNFRDIASEELNAILNQALLDLRDGQDSYVKVPVFGIYQKELYNKRSEVSNLISQTGISISDNVLDGNNNWHLPIARKGFVPDELINTTSQFKYVERNANATPESYIMYIGK